MKIWIVLCAVLILHIDTTTSQRTAIRNCEVSENDQLAACITDHVTNKFQQLSAQMNRLYASECDVQRAATSCELLQDVVASDMSLPENCLNIWNSGNTQNGVYTIYEPVLTTRISRFRDSHRRRINVYCEMDSVNDGPGWIVFQRRQDGSVNFTRLWDGYRDGFRDLSGEFWLGNDNLVIITGGDKTYELSVELGDWEGEMKYARYSAFRVEDENENFRLSLGDYVAADSTARDRMDQSRDQEFSTLDRDNDQWSNNCTLTYNKAGFWYNACGRAFLNNPYHFNSTSENRKGIAWLESSYSFKYTAMKIRPNPS